MIASSEIPGTPLTKTTRIQSVDLLRGLVMVLMAIDHVRVYSGVPAGGPDLGIFFTRWITHFCAPAFAFFAGTSAYLYGQKVGDKSTLAKYLISRGIILVILELTVLRFFWAFHIDYQQFTLAGVIWMLGWCMVGLAVLIWVKPAVTGLIGIGIILLQQLFSFVPQILAVPADHFFTKLWQFVYPSGTGTFQGIEILYVLVPWLGVMAAGYGFGLILKMEAHKRRLICLVLGIAMIVLFVVLGSILLLTSPSTNDLPFLLKLLNQRKYPASTLYLLMTLGPVIALVPYAEKTTAWLANALRIFGRVPFFYYVLHIPLIHLSALVVQRLRDGSVHSEWFDYAPYVYIEDPTFRWSLPLLYLVFAIDAVILFFICRWYARYKSMHPEKKWLAYL